MWVNVVNNGNNKYWGKKVAARGKGERETEREREKKTKIEKIEAEKNRTSSLCKSFHMIYSYNKDLFLLFDLVCVCVCIFFLSPFDANAVAAATQCAIKSIGFWFSVYSSVERAERSFDCILVFVFGCVFSFVLFNDAVANDDEIMLSGATICCIVTLSSSRLRSFSSIHTAIS